MQRLNEVDYVIATSDRRKMKRVIRVNLLKTLVSRDEVTVEPGSASESVTVNLISNVESNNVVSSVTVSDISLSHLEDDQVQLQQLLVRYADVFSDVPGKTNLMQHTIRLKEGVVPVAQAPYRLNPDKLKLVDKEIDDLLAEGIIERSDSAWAAPILLVPKPDDSSRLCTDFRKLNAVTITDTFPMPRVDD